MLLFIVILSCRLDYIQSFNVDIKHPIQLELGEKSKTLFGHSVIIDNDVAYVGAPEYQTRGAVFQCPFNGKVFDPQTSVCQKIPGMPYATMYIKQCDCLKHCL
jgi:hypothetical protein